MRNTAAVGATSAGENIPCCRETTFRASHSIENNDGPSTEQQNSRLAHSGKLTKLSAGAADSPNSRDPLAAPGRMRKPGGLTALMSSPTPRSFSRPGSRRVNPTRYMPKAFRNTTRRRSKSSRLHELQVLPRVIAACLSRHLWLTRSVAYSSKPTWAMKAQSDPQSVRVSILQGQESMPELRCHNKVNRRRRAPCSGVSPAPLIPESGTGPTSEADVSIGSQSFQSTARDRA